MPLISIVIPIYNSEQYLPRLFDSILHLKNLDYAEIIFVNDCSEDNSLLLVQNFIEKHKIGFLIDLEINSGLSKARYQGFLHSSGDYLMFIDSDDYVSENHIKNVIEYCNKGYDLIINSIIEVYQSGKIAITDKKNGVSKGGVIVEKKIAIKDLLENKNMCSYFVTKTIKRSLLDASVFDWPFAYEDVARMHLVFDKASSIYRLDNPSYYYVHNSLSIVGQRRNAIYRFLALKERYYYFDDGRENYCLVPFFDSVIDLVRYNKIREYKKYIKEIREIYKKKNAFINSSYIHNHMRLFMLFGPFFHHLFLAVFKK